MQTNKRRKLNGLCPGCGISWTGSTYNCTSCTEKARLRRLNKLKTNPDLCSRCIVNPPAEGYVYCNTCIPLSRLAGQKQRQKVRTAVIDKYGGCCNCCGNPNARVLQLDHVNNDGKLYRNKNGNNTLNTWNWAYQNDKSASLQLLCANCHHIKTHYGFCQSQDHMDTLFIQF
jgi:hypothetical protein